MSVERDQRWLEYIRECISLIQRDVRSDPEAFADITRASMRSIMWSLLTLSDATTKLSDELKARHPEVPWAKVRGFRNFAAHAYEKLRLQVISVIVQDDLPVIGDAVDTELAALRRGR